MSATIIKFPRPAAAPGTRLERYSDARIFASFCLAVLLPVFFVVAFAVWALLWWRP